MRPVFALRFRTISTSRLYLTFSGVFICVFLFFVYTLHSRLVSNGASYKILRRVIDGNNVTGKKNSYGTSVPLPTIYMITPTYKRFTQKADLTRLSHTLRLVPALHWIVVEDSTETTSLVRNLLIRSSIPFTQLNVKTTAKYKLKENDPNWLKPRGVEQRNEALKWLRWKKANLSKSAVVYFGDDDNTYDLQLFAEMRFTRKVAVWPVGLVGGLKYEGPVVHTGKVVGWIVAWKPERPFPIDMAGFAVNLQLIMDVPSAVFRADVPRGYVESSFLENLVTVDDLEPVAGNGTKILVWHTRTEKPKLISDTRLESLHMKHVMMDGVEF